MAFVRGIVGGIYPARPPAHGDNGPISAGEQQRRSSSPIPPRIGDLIGGARFPFSQRCEIPDLLPRCDFPDHVFGRTPGWVLLSS